MARSNSKYFLLGVLALLIALPLSGAFAGSTGKITGRVIDSSGSPLPGASVVIEGTQRGAIADADGFYVIIAVDPGLYDLTASLVGYSNVTKQDAEVKVDYTTTIDFDLKEQAIEAAEIVVTAERSPVEADKTSTKYVMTAEDIEQAPIIKTTGEFVSLQPGVDQAGTFSVRGSDISWGDTPRAWGTQSAPANDVYVLVDGVRIPNQDGHYAKLFTGVNKSAVQEISIETGVTSAEYGDAQAGTINIVTQDGGKAFHGWSEVNYEPSGQKHWGDNIYDTPEHRDHMQWDDPEWLKEVDPLTGRLIHVRSDYTSWAGVRMEGSVSGPIVPNVSFVASAKHERRAPKYPSATQNGFYDDRGHYMNAPNNLQTSGTLTFKPTVSTKLKTGLVLQKYTAFNDEVNEYNYAKEGFIRDTDHSLRNVFLPAEWASSGRYEHLEQLIYGTFTHTISPKTFYEIRVSHSRTSVDTTGFDWPYSPNNYRGTPKFTSSARKEADGWYIIDRDVAMWVQSDRKRVMFRGDLSSQITKGNFVKAGFEATKYSAYYTYWNARSKSDNWFTHYSGGDKPYALGSPANPLRAALYVQDKMEFEGLIVNVGLRMDFQQHGHEDLYKSGFHWAPMHRRFSNRHFGYGEGSVSGGLIASPDLAQKGPTWFYFSPRLGISHPVTDRMVMHFSLGRFVQWKDLYDNYSKSYRNFGRLGPDGNPNWQDVNGNGTWDAQETYANMDPHYSGFGGDTTAHPEETLTFEVGADWNFVSDYTTSMTIFYRSETNQLAKDGTHWLGSKRGSHYTRGCTNARAAYAKGVELAVGKRMSDYFSFRLSWGSQWTANGNMGLNQYGASTVPDSQFVLSPNFWYDFTYGADGTPTAVPLTIAEKGEFSSYNQGYIRSWTNSYRNHPQRNFGTIPEFYDHAIFIRYNSLGGNRYGPMGAWAGEKTGGILGQANVQFIINTPSDMNFGGRFLGWATSDLSVNMLWKMRTGTRIRWTPPGAERRRARRQINATTDLSLEKVFNAQGSVRPSFFVEIRNLFNDKIDTAGNTNYMRWGLMMSTPDNSDFLKYGDLGNRSYYAAPRQTNLGVRVSF